MGALSDARLLSMIGAASDIVDMYCKDHFEPVGTNEVQTITLTGFAATDSFRLTFNSVESAIITRVTNATAAGVKAVLDALSTISPNTVTVTGTTDEGPFVVTFDNGSLAVTDVGA